MSATPIYLGKDGKISGPFTPGQIEELRQNGQLYNYAWIWDVGIKGWKAIEEEVEVGSPALPPPEASEIIPVSTAEPSLSLMSGPLNPANAGLNSTNPAMVSNNPGLNTTNPGLNVTSPALNSTNSGIPTNPFISQTSTPPSYLNGNPAAPTIVPAHNSGGSSIQPTVVPAAPKTAVEPVTSPIPSLTAEPPGAGANVTNVIDFFDIPSVAQASAPGSVIDAAPKAASIDVICYNPHMMLSGKLMGISQFGCIFQSMLPTYSLATLKAGMKISMNLLNNADGQSENIRAAVRVVKRGEAFWEYELTWDRFPQILG